MRICAYYSQLVAIARLLELSLVLLSVKHVLDLEEWLTLLACVVFVITIRSFSLSRGDTQLPTCGGRCVWTKKNLSTPAGSTYGSKMRRLLPMIGQHVSRHMSTVKFSSHGDSTVWYSAR
jgi:hypothetical protein